MQYISIGIRLSAALLVLAAGSSCGQTKQTGHSEKDGVRVPETYIHEIENRIQYKPEGYLYGLYYKHTDCSYEILVNDMPVVTHFGIGERSLSADINACILKPGKQEVTIRIYPKKIDEQHFSASLSKESRVKITIRKDWRTADRRASDAYISGNKTNWEILQFETPVVEKDTSYAEFKVGFEIADKDMSWHLTGWSESEDLSRVPDLRKEVDAFYAAYKKILATGNTAKYLALLQNSIYEEAASIPWDRDAAKNIAGNMSAAGAEKRDFIYPCQNSRLQYYGNGKVVTLVCADTVTFGYAPLISKSAVNGLPRAHTFYLHKPRGNRNLQIIR